MCKLKQRWCDISANWIFDDMKYSRKVYYEFVENYNKVFENWLQNSTKFWKNRPLELSWSTLGALLAPRWSKSDTNRKIAWNICNFRVSKMERKSSKNLIKMSLIFGTRFWFQRSAEWGVSRSLFRPCCEYVRSVIWNNPPIVLLCILFKFESIDFRT